MEYTLKYLFAQSLAGNGQPLAQSLEAPDDLEAIDQARRLFQPTGAIEIWHKERFVAVLDEMGITKLITPPLP